MKSLFLAPVLVTCLLPGAIMAQGSANAAIALEATAPAGQDLVAKTEKELADLRARINKSCDQVEQAIAAGQKSKKISDSGADMQRSLLARYRIVNDVFPETMRIPVPMGLDGSEEMKAAWTLLRQDLQEIGIVGQAIADRLLLGIGEEGRKVARTGEGAAAVEALDRMVTAWQKFPDFSRISGQSFSSNHVRDLVEKTRVLFRQALTAREAKDVDALAKAFSDASGIRNSSFESRGGVTFRPEEMIAELRARCTEPLAKEVTELQRSVEKLLMEGKGKEQVELAVAQWQPKAVAVDRLRESTRYESSSTVTNLAALYRGAATVQDAVKAEIKPEDLNWNSGEMPERTANFSYSLSNLGTAHPVSPEFRVFLVKLQERQTERGQELATKRTKWREDANRAMAAKAEATRKEALTAAFKALAEKLNAVKTPEELTALVNGLPVAGFRTPGDANELGLSMILQPAYQEIRHIATFWVAGRLNEVADGGTLDGYRAGTDIHPLLTEVRALRDRALRDVYSRKLKLPQLKQPPLDALPIADALDKIAQEAAAKGEWKQCHDILRQVTQDTEVQERISAIRDYLTGQNLEAAGQYAEALEAYLKVLRSIAEPIPMKEAATQIKKLQQEHPELVKQRRPSAE